MSSYRDDSEAARARIAQLEAEVADLKAEMARAPATQLRIAQLRERRDDAAANIEAARRAMRSSMMRVASMSGLGGLVFVIAIANMGHSGHPLNAAIAALSAGALAVGAVWFSRARPIAEQQRGLRALDERIERLRSPSSGDSAEPHPTGVGPDDEEDVDESEKRMRR